MATSKATLMTAEEDDRRAFAAAMAGVQPLASRPAPPEPKPPPLGPRCSPSAPRAPSVSLQRIEPAAELLASSDPLAHGYAFLAAGEPHTRLRKLRAGHPEDSLDLHGRTGEQAERELVAFVARARRNGHRLLLVVHGRGRGSGASGPVLRERVVRSLSAGACAAHVLALASAPPALGGTGAALVWLRRPDR